MKRTLWFAWLVVPVLLAGAVAEEMAKHGAVTPVPREQEWWVKRHESINARVKKGNVDLIFVGDSITQGWEGAGREVWEKYYGHRRAANLGIGGDRTEHVLWRLDHGNVDGISPKVAVLMIGTNNCNKDGCPAQEIAGGIVAIVHKLRAKLPETKILMLAIFPRGEKPNEYREKLAQASKTASKLADGKMVHYMDIGVHFPKPDGTLTKDIMPDFLHLTARGYEMWAIAIEGKLRELLGEKP